MRPYIILAKKQVSLSYRVIVQLLNCFFSPSSVLMWNFLHSGLLDLVCVHTGAMSNLSKKGPATQFCITKCLFCFYMWGRGRQREREWGVLVYCFSSLVWKWRGPGTLILEVT